MIEKEIKIIEGLHYVAVITDLPYDSEGFFVVKSLKSGICTGGLRISSTVDLNEVTELAISMDRKFSIYNLPVGGAKSGLRIRESLSSSQREEVIQAFALSLKDELSEFYLTGSDMGSSPKDIEFIYKTIGLNQMLVSKRLLMSTGMKSFLFNIPDFILSKFPVGYSDYGDELTARGMLSCLAGVLGQEDESLKGKLINLHGVGKVGRKTLELLKDSEVLITSISDAEKTVLFQKPQDVQIVLKIIGEDGFVNVKAIHPTIKYNILSSLEGLYNYCDILILASCSNLIDEDNYRLIKTKYILEGANNTMAQDIDRKLFATGIKVLPDFAVNSAISCSFGLMLTNQVSPVFKRRFQSETTKYMQEVFLKHYENSKKMHQNIRDQLLQSLV